MNIRICTPVVGETIEQFLENLKKTQEVSEFVELRVDTIRALSMDHMRTIREATHTESILTCRSKDEGGEYTDPEDQRVKLLQRGIGLFEYVDLELSTVQAHDFSCDEKTKIILSYHNFIETPSYWDMQKVIFEMNKYKPDILKIATMVNEEYEAGKIYRMLTNKPKDENRIVIGMGEKGRMTRILGPLLGSYLTFASTPWGESAPGQIELEEMKKIYNIINPNPNPNPNPNSKS